MTSVNSAVPRLRRRTAVGVLVAALLGAGAYLAMSAGSAQAASASCPKKEFCLYYTTSFNSGLYHFSGSDSNLGNDVFERMSNRITVANAAESAWNNGRADPGRHDDVAVYTGRSFTGRAGCIRLGQRGDLRVGFQNNVESYRWVTPATCNTMPSALVLPGGP
jgi:hypothetical protein